MMMIRFDDHDQDDTVDEDNNDDHHDHDKDSHCLGYKLLMRRLNWKKMMILTLRIKRMEPLIDNNYHF